MKHINRLHAVKKRGPKKETIDFILAYSKSYTSVATKKGKTFMLCNN